MTIDCHDGEVMKSENFDRMTSPSGAIKNVPKFSSEFWRMDIDGRMLWTWFSRSQLNRLPMSRWSFLRRGGQRHWTRTWPSKTYKTDRALEDPGFTLVLSCFYHFFIHICMSKSDAEFHLRLSVHFILATAGHLWTQIGPDTAPLRGCFKPLYIYYTVDVIHCTPRPIFTFCVKIPSFLTHLIRFKCHGMVFLDKWSIACLHAMRKHMRAYIEHIGGKTCLSHGDNTNTVQTTQWSLQCPETYPTFCSIDRKDCKRLGVSI